MNKLKDILLTTFMWISVWLIMEKLGVRTNWNFNMGALAGYIICILTNKYLNKD